MSHAVTLIRGDGIGPEVAAATRTAIDATGVKIDWVVVDAGVDMMERYGTPLPEHVLDAIKSTKTAIKGPITTPVGTGFRSVNVEIRKRLNLYANLRPAKSIVGVKSYFQNIDLVIVRENTEDLYAGIEFEYTSPEAAKARAFLSDLAGKPIREDAAIGVKPISVLGSDRIIEFAFKYAKANHRQKVTAVHKANIMKFTDGLFLERAREIATRYPDIAFEDRIVDNMCMQLMQKPELYDVMVMPNLYGDILSDLCAGMIGGLGVAPGANIGDEYAVFEAIHGSAPKYAGQNKANPTALILSGVLMLQHLGEMEAARRLQAAVEKVIAEGRFVTYDLAAPGKEPVGTQEMAAAIAEYAAP
ncbi:MULTISPECIES: isocitrate/isopropylmalate dehydrogenase family protein [unclassified Thermosynechococcus]|uniref:isocitrate/isopropylmalate dehydrogenase family protein n=1 Tax=unclassified Thermosynechococcus TaxID=2622553 RepID=UPI00122E0F84|nr:MULTISPECIES: isocitrate/isopropylmalate dehydrogenase family protein [unclassified Thermosynechococcus]QEQ00017.1 isocitrate/isopropylmalate dehydrogenase family protein [Thermosynechococcus sp. CL-1]WJI26720.1 isocitrate/isopropylmalate dehydrogenase family protein [Thermosynechococcus sp. B1]WJI29248.1 isocitrate/isopropylmalate dehydrogenase family protein [Thermosynechococcus sp. B3]WNC32631.1 isocitrate/isopropylmalate dehydrogenase family protein [Thermosynechococcus sp. PKX95]WNC351